MVINTIYGIGGFCAECDESHDHPMHNIISQEEVLDEVAE